MTIYGDTKKLVSSAINQVSSTGRGVIVTTATLVAGLGGYKAVEYMTNHPIGEDISSVVREYDKNYLESLLIDIGRDNPFKDSKLIFQSLAAIGLGQFSRKKMQKYFEK